MSYVRQKLKTFCLQCDCRFSALAALRDFALYKCT